MRRFLVLCSVLAVLSACSDYGNTNVPVPQSQIEAKKARNGKLTGDDGLLIFGKSDAEKSGGGSPLGVNSFLWRATLDTLAFMPLASADPFGGVIITDWYEDPSAPGTRFKVNALILDRSLRADGVKLTVFKQSYDQKAGWRDLPVDDKLGRSLEDTILTRARQMKVAQLGK